MGTLLGEATLSFSCCFPSHLRSVLKGMNLLLFKLLLENLILFFKTRLPLKGPSHIAQSVGHLTCLSEVLGMILWPYTFVSSSADSRGAVVSYWQKYVYEVLVNCFKDTFLIA